MSKGKMQNLYHKYGKGREKQVLIGTKAVKIEEALAAVAKQTQPEYKSVKNVSWEGGTASLYYYSFRPAGEGGTINLVTEEEFPEFVHDVITSSTEFAAQLVEEKLKEE